ncbi:hypothetical protein [Streptomyces sp. NBC_00094]|uniref:DNA polymerase Y family protein n=1 Tax=Streptomyces sp. NBC_00094 TaxID=2903620 RepID=UPI002B1D6AD7|nr:hypothetical protein [Streptomyces sp. NBC_00094]
MRYSWPGAHAAGPSCAIWCRRRRIRASHDDRHRSQSAGHPSWRAGHDPRHPGRPRGDHGVPHRLPAAALLGVGPATARTLISYGLATADQIAATPLPTLQRILGTATGRQLHRVAAGIDPTRVTPGAPPRTFTAEHRFPRDELDPGRQRGALTHLAKRLGARLRAERQACDSLALTVQYADRSTTTRSRTLPEPTAHSPGLRTAAHALYLTLGLQRARVRCLTLRVGDLCDAGSVSRQLTFGLDDDKARRIEAAADRARARFGPGAVRPASTAGMP